MASLKDDLTDLHDQLQLNPFLGESLGNSCYKVRLAVKSKGKGKRGGARVITHVIIRVTNGKNYQVFLAAIYDKSEDETMTEKMIRSLIKNIAAEDE